MSASAPGFYSRIALRRPCRRRWGHTDRVGLCPRSPTACRGPLSGRKGKSIWPRILSRGGQKVLSILLGLPQIRRRSARGFLQGPLGSFGAPGRAFWGTPTLSASASRSERPTLSASSGVLGGICSPPPFCGSYAHRPCRPLRALPTDLFGGSHLPSQKKNS